MASTAGSASSLRVLVYGGAGALGKAIVSRFKTSGAVVDSVDFVANVEASKNFSVDNKFEESLTKLVKDLEAEFESVGGALYDAVVCAAGGWAGGSLGGDTKTLLDGVSKMHAMNTQSALASAHIAAKFLKQGGLTVLTGANAARSGTPGMVGYGLAKSATHQLAQSLHELFTSSKSNSSVVTVLPITLDTPSNRQAMPHADFSTWTPADEVASAILSWTSTTASRPGSGTMLLVETKNGATSWTPVRTEY